MRKYFPLIQNQKAAFPEVEFREIFITKLRAGKIRSLGISLFELIFWDKISKWAKRVFPAKIAAVCIRGVKTQNCISQPNRCIVCEGSRHFGVCLCRGNCRRLLEDLLWCRYSVYLFHWLYVAVPDWLLTLRPGIIKAESKANRNSLMTSCSYWNQRSAKMIPKIWKLFFIPI